MTTEDRIDAYLRNGRLSLVGKKCFEGPLRFALRDSCVIISDAGIKQSVGKPSALIILEDLRKEFQDSICDQNTDIDNGKQRKCPHKEQRKFTEDGCDVFVVRDHVFDDGNNGEDHAKSDSKQEDTPKHGRNGRIAHQKRL